MPLRFLTAGDSHGRVLTGIIDGLPAGIPVPLGAIQRELARRRKPLGRSSRQQMETDRVEITGGIRRGKTTGAPLALSLPNTGPSPGSGRKNRLGTIPRPGHADLAGCLKYGFSDITPIAERASARSTAMRVAIGAVCKCALRLFSLELISHVRAIGTIAADPDLSSLDRLKRKTARSPIYCADGRAEKRMLAAIETAGKQGYTLGGSVELIATGVPAGLGSHTAWDRRLDARLAGALMSIPSIKAVEIGDGLAACTRKGFDAQDAIEIKQGALRRPTNTAGGIEGGISNGEDIIVRLFAKPIPSALRQASTIDLMSLDRAESPAVRSDVCVVPAIGVIAESVAAWELLGLMLERFGGDHIDDTVRNAAVVQRNIHKRFKR